MRLLLDTIYEEIIHSAALNSTCDEVEVSLAKLDTKNLWESLFPDKILILIKCVREACLKDAAFIGEEI
jgi:hypothetical protein